MFQNSPFVTVLQQTSDLLPTSRSCSTSPRARRRFWQPRIPARASTCSRTAWSISTSRSTRRSARRSTTSARPAPPISSAGWRGRCRRRPTSIRSTSRKMPRHRPRDRDVRRSAAACRRPRIWLPRRKSDPPIDLRASNLVSTVATTETRLPLKMKDGRYGYS